MQRTVDQVSMQHLARLRAPLNRIAFLKGWHVFPETLL
jgi:hypothetical protein